MVMRGCLKVQCWLLYVGRYETLCAGTLLNKTLWDALFFWTPRQIRSLGEMRWKPWPEAEVEYLAVRDSDFGDNGPWCTCMVTSSDGPKYIATDVDN